MAVVPIRRPVAAEHEQLWIDWPTIEIGNFNWMVRVSKVHHGDAALIPCLDFDIATRNRNERPIVRHAILSVALGSGHLVVTRKFQLAVLQVENCIRAPLVRISRTTTRTQSAAPLVGEHALLSIIRKS